MEVAEHVGARLDLFVEVEGVTFDRSEGVADEVGVLVLFIFGVEQRDGLPLLRVAVFWQGDKAIPGGGSGVREKSLQLFPNSYGPSLSIGSRSGPVRSTLPSSFTVIVSQ
ncbi:hypothetical protein C3B44_08210 [Corynebacterium yudongzhengii]|uniref:Uncharacterized protein n=1 Tax=Corynebacterium yudongzhengii TaxID=2080740 RepID=A0A2U1T7S6_9CORY|nr:hypothetical protein [Corynebacterium yudongzhengii]AWB82339.1 hypothetical protein C3B44_08210 [Corynebacterium yudongzhengii]PWC02042.1 hypothetical protein DF222_04165 [Corynebacterium yudongzhengii]